MLKLARILLSAPDTEGVETTYYSYRVEEEESFSAAVNLEGRQGKQWRDSLHKWLKVKLPGLFLCAALQKRSYYAPQVDLE